MKIVTKRILAVSASAVALVGFWFLPTSDSSKKADGYVAIAPNSSYVSEADDPSAGVSDRTMPSYETTDGISLVSVTSPVSAGSKITLTVRGKPDSEFEITVVYSSGPSTAQGLGSAMSDDSGYVSWTWRVGASTKPGTYTATVSGEDGILEIPFVVQ